MASLTGSCSPSSTRQESHTLSPSACGPAMRRTHCLSDVRLKWKNGPTVCDGVGISSMSFLKWRSLGPAQHDVKFVGGSPLRLCGVQIEAGNHALPRLFVRHRLKNGIKGKQWIARKIHLRDQTRNERSAEHGKMDMGWTPGVEMVR